MNKETYIYALEYPKDNIRYIGKANDPEERLKGHLQGCKKVKTYKDRLIKGLLDRGETPILSIIDKVNKEDWGFWEKYYISLYKSWGFKLTNLSFGGDGDIMSNPVSVEKMRKTLKESYKSGKIKVWNKGLTGISIGWEKGKLRDDAFKEMRRDLAKKQFEETDVWNKGKKLHYDVWNKGKEHSEESKQKMSEVHKKRFETETVWNKGVKMRESSRLKMIENLPQSIPVIQFSLEGEFIKEWDSAGQVSRELGINHVRANCKGNNRSSGGFLWLEKEEHNNYPNLIKERVESYKNRFNLMSRGSGGDSPSSKKVLMFCEKTSKFVKEFGSIKCACKHMNHSKVGRYIKTGRPLKGFIFKFAAL